MSYRSQREDEYNYDYDYSRGNRGNRRGSRSNRSNRSNRGHYNHNHNHNQGQYHYQRKQDHIFLNNQNQKRTRLSKYMSYVLRHGAEKEGIAIASDGYVNVNDLLSKSKIGDMTLNDIITIVNECPKKRFTLRQGEDDVYYIRANQGHSIESVNSNELLKKLTLADVAQYPIVVHGTTSYTYDLIVESGGLRRMHRNHIHFATGLPGDNKTISGMRRDSDVLIFINLKKALEDNVPFYVSDNGVILCPGVEDTGMLPEKYFSHVTHLEDK